MQGLKVEFDERSISDLKQNFDNLIKDLESKSTININFNQDAFKNINNQIDEINNKLAQVGNKVRDNIKINVTTNADTSVLSNKLNNEEKIIREFAKKVGIEYNDELKKAMTGDISESLSMLNKIEEQVINKSNKNFKKDFIENRKEELENFRKYFKGQVFGISSKDFDNNELKQITDNFKGLINFQKDDPFFPSMDEKLGEISDVLNMPHLKDMVYQDAVKYLSEFNAEYKNLKNLNIGNDLETEEYMMNKINKDYDEMVYKLEQLKQVKNDAMSAVKNNSIKEENIELLDKKNILNEIKDKFREVGEVNFKNKTFDPITKELTGFTAEVKKADGIIDKFKYSLVEINNQQGFQLSKINQVDKSAELAEKTLQKTQQIRQNIAKETEKIELYKVKMQKSIDKLYAKDVVPKDVIFGLEKKVNNVDINTTKSDYQAIESEMKKINELQTEIINNKKEDKKQTKETMEEYIRQQERIQKLGEKKASLPNKNLFSDDDKLKDFLKNLSGADAKITDFARGIDKYGNAQVKATVTTKNANNEVHREKIVVDETTQSIYKNSEATRANTSRMVGFVGRLKNAIVAVSSFASVTTAFYAGMHQIKQGIEMVTDLNKMQTNIQMITGMDRSKVQGITQDFSELAGQLHSTTKETMAGAEEFLRAGKSVAETKNLLESATIGGKISGQETKEVSEQLIAIANGYKINVAEGQKVMDIVDKLSTVDNNASTSFRELATAMKYTSSTAQSVNVEMPTLISYIGTVSSVSRKSAESIGK